MEVYSVLVPLFRPALLPLYFPLQQDFLFRSFLLYLLNFIHHQKRHQEMDQLLGFESNACQLVLLHQILLPAKDSIVHVNDMPEAKFLKNCE